MQRIVGMILILWGLGWLVSEMPATPEDPTVVEASAWRRTCEGWERARWFAGDLSRPRPALHPAVFGVGLLMFSLAGLIGLAPEDASSVEL